MYNNIQILYNNLGTCMSAILKTSRTFKAFESMTNEIILRSKNQNVFTIDGVRCELNSHHRALDILYKTAMI
jgi:hypothetical protein